MIGLLSQQIRVVCCARGELVFVIEDVGRFFLDLTFDVEQAWWARSQYFDSFGMLAKSCGLCRLACRLYW